MLSDTHKELDEILICQHLSNVTAKSTAWVLLQEPGFIGFGVVQIDKISWPPNVQPDWTRVSDLRLFGEKGEWHVWPHWNGWWESRLLTLEDIKDALTEYHVLWGTSPASDISPWVRLIEDRGAEIRLPLEGADLKETDLPLRLKVKQVVDYDSKYHLAGVVDAALVALVRSSDEEIIIPPLFTSCT